MVGPGFEHPVQHVLGQVPAAEVVVALQVAEWREQFPRHAGLGQVIVGAEFQTDDPVDIVAQRAQHEDGRVLGPLQPLAAITGLMTRLTVSYDLAQGDISPSADAGGTGNRDCLPNRTSPSRRTR